MKTLITLTEAEIKLAVIEYIENNTHHLDEIDAEKCVVSLERAGETGEYVATLEAEERL